MLKLIIEYAFWRNNCASAQCCNMRWRSYIAFTIIFLPLTNCIGNLIIYNILHILKLLLVIVDICLFCLDLSVSETNHLETIPSLGKEYRIYLEARFLSFASSGKSNLIAFANGGPYIYIDHDSGNVLQ